MYSNNIDKRAPAPVFIATTIVIFFLSLSAADSVGFVPCYVDGSECLPAQAGLPVEALMRAGAPASVALADLPELGSELVFPEVVPEAPSVSPVLPTSIVISGIDLDLPVQNPQTRDIAGLDKFLKDGPVRYMDSARLGEEGNVLIFAHTSHLPIVKNQMYKAFNRVPELSPGDTITVQGEGRSYVYSVNSVRKANAEDAIIDLSPTLGKKLTLVTCDTLTSKNSRFILEADFVAVL